MAVLYVDKISLDTFKTALARYSDIAPSALAELDTLRYETVPAKLASMERDKHLLKSDVERLVEWKLKHGTFRPALMNLVKSNSADLMKSTTQSAFCSLNTSSDVLKALKILITLRGIGPATASLLLNIYQPDAIPFFSDELFRWTHWDGSGASGSGAKAGAGWERKIKYNLKEYEGILERVGQLRKRLGVGATEAEKVAYVLGKEQADVDGSGVDSGVEQKSVEVSEKKTAAAEMTDEAESRLKEIAKAIRSEELKITDGGNGQETVIKASERKSKTAEEKGTKRKAEEQKRPAEGTRRSTRRKT